VLACTGLWASAAQARTSYDCADISYNLGDSWEPTDWQQEQFYSDLAAAYPAQNDFMIRSCAVIEGGRKLFLVGALHIVDNSALCDDEANFGVLYDPATRKFGEVVPHQKLCGRGAKIPRPQR
jgi:hypothetical protein